MRVVGEIAHVVNGEWCRPHVRAETLLEHAGGLLLGEVEDQIRSREETRRVASKDRLMDEIVGDHRLPGPGDATTITFSRCATKSRVRTRSTVGR